MENNKLLSHWDLAENKLLWLTKPRMWLWLHVGIILQGDYVGVSHYIDSIHSPSKPFCGADVTLVYKRLSSISFLDIEVAVIANQ